MVKGTITTGPSVMVNEYKSLVGIGIYTISNAVNVLFSLCAYHCNIHGI